MKSYLPIGTIVILKNGNKKLMIYGRRQLNKETRKVFDYISCMYPEGNINSHYSYLFNEEDINEVIFRGYSDADEEVFLNVLNDVN